MDIHPCMDLLNVHGGISYFNLPKTNYAFYSMHNCTFTNHVLPELPNEILFFFGEKFNFHDLVKISLVHVHGILVPNKTMHGGKFENEHAPCMHGY